MFEGEASVTRRANAPLSELEQRIVGALQIDGRAPWKKIAEILDEPERTVSRHGTALLERGLARVAAVPHSEHQIIAMCETAPGTARLAAEALADRADVVYSYLMSGGADVVAEVGYDDHLADLVTVALPSIPGTQRIRVFPKLKYFKTVRGWRIGALTTAEASALETTSSVDKTEWTMQPNRNPNDDLIIRALQDDGRASYESIARQLKMSESALSRRIDWLLGTAQMSIRTLVEPSAVGLPVEVMAWVQASPHRIEEIGGALAERPEVRYAAAIAGEWQLVVNVTVESHAQLYHFLADELWAGESVRVRTDFVLAARKRGGRRVSPASLA